jgi:hypothetical protein
MMQNITDNSLQCKWSVSIGYARTKSNITNNNKSGLKLPHDGFHKFLSILESNV